MTEQVKNTTNPILKFNGKKYEINSLSDKAKTLIRASQAADNQKRLADENLELLKIASQAISSKLVKELESQESVE